VPVGTLQKCQDRKSPPIGATLLLADGVSYDRFRKPDYKAFQPAVLFLENLKLLLQFCISGELIVRKASFALDPFHNAPLVRLGRYFVWLALRTDTVRQGRLRALRCSYLPPESVCPSGWMSEIFGIQRANRIRSARCPRVPCRYFVSEASCASCNKFPFRSDSVCDQVIATNRCEHRCRAL